MSEFTQGALVTAAAGILLFNIYILDTLKDILKEIRKKDK